VGGDRYVAPWGCFFGGGGVISVLLVDDQPLLRRGFRMILEAEDGLTVAGEAGDGAEAVALAAQLRPDVVLMDIRMPGTDGIAATRRITAAEPSVRVLVLTTFDLDEYAFGALQAGASGFLLKDVRPHELVAAVRTVASGDAVVSPRVTRRLLEEYATSLPVNAAAADDAGPGPDRFPQLATLTEREREVLEVVAQGLSNTEIATSLFVSETTVKSHVGRILAKLGLRDRVQIVVLAYESGLVKPGRSKALYLTDRFAAWLVLRLARPALLVTPLALGGRHRHCARRRALVPQARHPGRDAPGGEIFPGQVAPTALVGTALESPARAQPAEGADEGLHHPADGTPGAGPALGR
jgi:DNA-binding NarL/FixJ family response regulator